MRRILYDPFLHFILLGSAIFFASQHWQAARQQYTIAVSADQIQSIAARYEKQFGAPPRGQQLRFLIDRYVSDEILYREGLVLGLDRGDEIVRRRIVQKLEFLVQDREIVQEPSEPDLENYYQQNLAQYRTPERVSFSHIYFSPDKTRDDAQVRASGAITKLNSSESNLAQDIGDRFFDLYDYSDVDELGVMRVFGDSPFSTAVFDAPLKQWSGPVQSAYGWHLVYVHSREASRLPPLAQIRKLVAAEYREDARRRKNAEAFARLEQKYTVIRADAADD